MLQYLDECKIEMFKSKLIGLGIEDAKKNVDEDIYQNLIKISYKYLDEYYLQTRQQAQKGFFVTVYVAIVGAIIVAIGIVAMFFGKTTPAYVTTASGVVTEFIAAVFFYLYSIKNFRIDVKRTRRKGKRTYCRRTYERYKHLYTFGKLRTELPFFFLCKNRGDYMEIRARPRGLIFVRKIKKGRLI